MKKIMKKVMSVALVVMMVLTLAPMTVFAEEPVGSAGNPETLVFEGTYTGKSATITTPNVPYYCKVVAPADGVIAVGGYAHSEDWMDDLDYKLVVGDNEPVNGTGSIESQNISVSEGDTVVFNYSLASEGCLDLDVYFFAVGSESNPESIEIGDYSATFEEYASNYYYEWIATGTGTATVTVNTGSCLNGWQYQVNNITKDAYNTPNSSIEGAATQDIAVSAGDVVQININTCGELSMYDTPAGTVSWTLSFTAGGSNPDPEPDPEPEPEEYELGHYMNPYQLTTDGTVLRLPVAAEGTVYVKAGSTNYMVLVGDATGSDWSIYYGRQEVRPTMVDGCVTASFGLMPGNDIFSVYNYGEEAVTVYMMLVEAEEEDTTGTMDDPAEITLEQWPGGVFAKDFNADLASGNEGYYWKWVATAAGKVTFKNVFAIDGQHNEIDWRYSINNVTAGKYGDTNMSTDEEPVVEQMFDVAVGDEIVIFISTFDPQNMWTAPAGKVGGTIVFEPKTVEEDGPVKEYVTPASGDGTDEKPFVIETFGLYLAPKSEVQTYYKWIATADGVLTLTISEEDAEAFKSAYVYSINEEPVDREFEVAVNANEVKKGDVVIIATYSGTKALEFTAEFKAGAKLEKDESTEKPATNANDEQDYDEIVTGKVELDTTVITTLFVLTPDKVGKYTITAPTGVKVENWNVPSNPMNRTENATNTGEIECTAVGQTFLVGITAAETVTEIDVNVKFTAVEQKEEVEWTIFAVTSTLEKFETVLSGLEYVDVEDSVVDKAVLGKDGFYHLNSVNGPILYADLNEEMMSLFAAADLGKLVEYVTEDGEVIAKISYNEAVLAYFEVANKDGLYPLTTDLVTIFKNAGAYAGWYGEDGFLGFTEEDAWMFACYYEADAEDGSGEADSEDVVVVPLPTPEAGKEDADVVVDKDYLDEHIQQAIKDDVALELPTSNENVTMTFDPNELADADEIEINLTVNVVADAKDETVAKNDKITDKNFVLKVEFSHEGKLPAEAVISIQLPATIAEKYEKLFYYQIMADGSLKFVCDAPVVDGVAKVTQDHCSDYVLLTEKLIDVPGTGDSTNVGIWFAVLALGALAIAGGVVMRKKEF